MSNKPCKTSEAIASLWNENSFISNLNVFNALRTATLVIAESKNQDGWSWGEKTQIEAAYDFDTPKMWTARTMLFSRLFQNSRTPLMEHSLCSEQEYFDIVTQDWSEYLKFGNGFDSEWSKDEKLIAQQDVLFSMHRNDIADVAVPRNYSQKLACWLFDQVNLFKDEASLNDLLCRATETNSVEILEWAFKHGANPNAMVFKQRPGYEIPVVAIAPSLNVLNVFLANGLDPEITTAKGESISSFIQSRSEYVFQFVKGDRPKLLKSVLQLESKIQKDPQTHLWRLIRQSDKVGDAVAAARSIKSVDGLRDAEGRNLIQYALLMSPEAVSALLNTNKKIASLIEVTDAKGRAPQSYFLASSQAQNQTGNTNATMHLKTFVNEEHFKRVWKDAFDIALEQNIPNIGVFSESVESSFANVSDKNFIEFINKEFIPSRPNFYKEMLDWQSRCVDKEDDRRRSTGEKFSYNNRGQLYREVGYGYGGSDRNSALWHHWITDTSSPKDEYEATFKVQFKLAALRMGAGYSQVFDPESLNEKNKDIEKEIKNYLFTYGTPAIYDKITEMLTQKKLATSEGDGNFFAKSEWWRNIGTQIERNCLLDRQKSVTNKKTTSFDGAL